MAEYLKLNSRNVTLREYWNITRSWKALIPWVAARLGAGMNFGGFPYFKSVKEMEIAETQLDADVRAKLQPSIDEALQAGAHSPRFYFAGSLDGTTRTWFISFLHRSGRFGFRLGYTLSVNGTIRTEMVNSILLTELPDARYLMTSNDRLKFRPPPGLIPNCIPGAGITELVETHQRKLTLLDRAGSSIESAESLEALWDGYEQYSIQFQLKRGIYSLMTPEEVAAFQKPANNLSAELTAAPVSEEADILAEMARVQNKKSSSAWGTALLVISLLLFVGAGSWQWSWSFLLILIPVLFFHELGHYFAMRAFNYRNLRMFFIPFFGAAVAGRHYNVPGWKKVIVSMMGPAPGILLGAMIGITGFIFHQPLLIQIGLVALILNGFNLLPVLPLDGGWIFHTLLFSRHPTWDAIFRVIAVFALIGMGMRLDSKLLMFIGIPMLLGIPLAYRLARVTRTLREQGVSSASPDNESVPPETAKAIIGELRKVLPASHSRQMLAQQALQVFESLNARPPTWLTTAGLLLVYAVAFGMAVIFAAFLFMGRGGNLFLPGSKQTTANRPIECGQIAGFPSPDSPLLIQGRNTLTADFKNVEEARLAFREATNRLDDSMTAKLFGSTVFFTYPATNAELRKQWFSELDAKAKTVHIISSNAPASFSLSCEFPSKDIAKAVEAELNQFVEAAFKNQLIPPWHPYDSRSEEERANHQQARIIYVKAEKEKWSNDGEASTRGVEKELKKAMRQGDDAEAAALRKKIKDMSYQAARERLARLKAVEAADQGIIELVASLLDVEASTNRALIKNIHEQLVEKMGPLPKIDGLPDKRFAVSTVLVSSEDRTLEILWASFASISDGAPAMVNWLCHKGGSKIRYDIQSNFGVDSDAFDEDDE